MEFNLILDLMVIMDLAVQPKKPTRFKRWECHDGIYDHDQQHDYDS